MKTNYLKKEAGLLLKRPIYQAYTKQ